MCRKHVSKRHQNFVLIIKDFFNDKYYQLVVKKEHKVYRRIKRSNEYNNNNNRNMKEKIIVIVAVIRDAKKFICMIFMDKTDH